MRRLGFVLILIAATAARASADAAADAVKNNLIAFAKLTSYHMTVTTSGKTIDVDMVNPNKMHVTVGSIEAIMLDGAMYVKPQSNWMKIPAAASGMAGGAFMGAVDRAKEAVNQENFTATDLGTKTVGGASLHAYLVKSKDASKPATMYFDSAGMLARVEIDGDRGGTTAIVYSKYNAPIKIEAPI